MGEKISRYREISRRYGDPWIWGIYLTLIVLSIIESYSASSRDIALQGVYAPLIRQVAFLGFGAVFVVGLSRINYNNRMLLLVLIPLLWIFSVLSLGYVMFFGVNINGAMRSFIVPGLRIPVQPSEFAKLSAVTALAYIMAKSQRERDVSWQGLILSSVVVGMFGFLMYDNGLTNTLLLMAISGSMFMVGGASLRKLTVLVILFIVVGGAVYGLRTTMKHRQENLEKAGTELVDDNTKKVDRSKTRDSRIEKWLRSDSLLYDAVTGDNSQEMFSRMAMAHGGVIGVGVGNSRECSRLPLAFSDYIFSIIVEELGLIGGIFVLILYLWLLSRAAMIARRCHRVLPALLIIGMAAMITFQALFHMAINTGVFPVSGQPLPLISKGGASILVTSIAFGVMLSVSRTISNITNAKNKDEGIVLPSGLDAANPTEIPVKNEWKSTTD